MTHYRTVFCLKINAVYLQTQDRGEWTTGAPLYFDDDFAPGIDLFRPPSSVAFTLCPRCMVLEEWLE